jgi:hypothetical protein
LRFKKKGDRRSIHGRSPLFSPRALHRGETLTYVACLNASTSRWRNCTDVLSDPDVELGDAMSRIGARTELGVPLLRERIAAGGGSMLVPSGIHAKYPIPRNAESLRNPRFSRAFTSKITHSIPRRPRKKIEAPRSVIAGFWKPRPRMEKAADLSADRGLIHCPLRGNIQKACEERSNTRCSSQVSGVVSGVRQIILFCTEYEPIGSTPFAMSLSRRSARTLAS